MAQPDYTPAELAQLIQTTPPGTKVGQFTFESRTLLYDHDVYRVWTVVVSRGASTWTGVYTEAPGGGLGKVYGLTDDQGRTWLPFLEAGGWV